ncbi:MAG: dTDP-4-dehydrorhamnose 3,5-epimerase [Muribaculaceae bacterium]|nr:dTDP-4-dehydrorhamnose 3,5-epimerase [Muribaculaceae bacterium]
MKFIPTDIPGAWIIEPVRHGDARGYFVETFRADLFADATGIRCLFVQDNESFSTRGVLRGLHYQMGDDAQAKLVRVSRGRVFDVAVDLRRDSPAYGRHVAVELSAENGRQLYIPRGCAHGFLVLSDDAQFQYKVDNYYAPASERCWRYDSPALGIQWPVEGLELNLSEKDLNSPEFHF